jgi:hypothetical protein
MIVTRAGAITEGENGVENIDIESVPTPPIPTHKPIVVEAQKPIDPLLNTGWMLASNPYVDGVFTIVSRVDNIKHMFTAENEITARAIAFSELSISYNTNNLKI